mgnify:CR=1 FL=1
MITIDEAFRKFKSRLELNQKEQDNASARHKEVREYIGKRFAIADDFLTGSYRRNTKSKPLKDIDIFFVLKESERGRYREKAPSVVLEDFRKEMAANWGEHAVKKQGRSVGLDFGVYVDPETDNTDYRILSIDAVPAFKSGEDYEIPCTDSGKWIKTNPKIHEEKAVAANQAYASEWKGIVRMLKYWNNNKKHGQDKPIKPSFLIEVMALQCLHPPWSSQFDREFEAIFSTLADRITDEWKDPAGLGPPISNGMDAARKQRARTMLQAAAAEARVAINHTKAGRNGAALDAWRALFGPKFPLS